MDIASMIMGASIASVAWIAFYPWAKLKRLAELEASAEGREVGNSGSQGVDG
ncbi:hypothetical protein [Herbiconiux sp.]|uniref:hypothetical protein n=1 Tax=Herbiconiux sp. TaxID=1871186 RepID=UPI0025B879ED|nr:hypothetical protein [Herbiconiux sp.]